MANEKDSRFYDGERAREAFVALVMRQLEAFINEGIKEMKRVWNVSNARIKNELAQQQQRGGSR